MTQASPLTRPRGLTGRKRILLWGGAAFVLLIPLIAMEFTGEVAWEPGDFIIFGAMLALLCLAVEISLRMARSRLNAALAIGMAVLVFLLIWAELAVGIFD